MRRWNNLTITKKSKTGRENALHVLPVMDHKKPNEKPFEMITLDLTGTFTVTNDGDRYIFDMTDYCSKWLDAYTFSN